MSIDIGSGKAYPADALSNFRPRKFIFDGVECNSIEGLIQSLKFKDINMQVYVCTLVGKQAKFKGKKKKWWKLQELYWKGKVYKRDSDEYQSLLDKIYMAVYEQCPKFRSALEATKGSKLTHSIGKKKITDTVLTENELCSRLMNLRDNNGILNSTKK